MDSAWPIPTTAGPRTIAQPSPMSAPVIDTGEFGLNQGIWTVMSYNFGWRTVPSSSYAFGWEGTPMAFDVAALQELYGANLTYNTGDNVYHLPGVNAAGTFWSCIWDAGGIDTISADGLAGNCFINLNDAPLTGENAGGYVSWMAGIRGGFTIAHDVLDGSVVVNVIENAIGGKGNDKLIGNEFDNQLSGGLGKDTMVGGDGSDTMIGGRGNDLYVVDDLSRFGGGNRGRHAGWRRSRAQQHQSPAGQERREFDSDRSRQDLQLPATSWRTS